MKIGSIDIPMVGQLVQVKDCLTLDQALELLSGCTRQEYNYWGVVPGRRSIHWFDSARRIVAVASFDELHDFAVVELLNGRGMFTTSIQVKRLCNAGRRF